MDNIYFEMAKAYQRDILENEEFLKTFREIFRERKQFKKITSEIITELNREIREWQCKKRFYQNIGKMHEQSLRKQEKEEAQSSPQG